MNAQAFFITGTSGAEKLLRINSGRLANTHSAGISAFSSLGGGTLLKNVGLFTEAFINHGLGLPIEDFPFVGLRGLPGCLMQLKIVL